MIFNENLASRLGIPRPLTPDIPVSPIPTHVLDRPRIRTSMGRAYDDVIAFKRPRNEECQRQHLLLLDGGVRCVDDERTVHCPTCPTGLHRIPPDSGGLVIRTFLV